VKHRLTEGVLPAPLASGENAVPGASMPGCPSLDQQLLVLMEVSKDAQSITREISQELFTTNPL